MGYYVNDVLQERVSKVGCVVSRTLVGLTLEKAFEGSMLSPADRAHLASRQACTAGLKALLSAEIATGTGRR